VEKISVKSATAVSLGAIIGAGIFVLSGTAVAISGIYSLGAFLLVGIVAMILAMIMSELSSIMPRTKGASYSFAYKAFGSEIGFITGIALYSSFSTAIGAIALGFGSYLASIAGIGAGMIIPFAILLIVVLTVVNILGISKAAKTDLVLVTIKIGILLIFAAFAIFFAMHAGVAKTSINFSAKGFSPIDMFSASVAIFFAYSGFQTVATFANSVEGGEEGVKKAIVGSVAISLAIYVLIDLALLLLAPPSAYKINADPLAFALEIAKAPKVMSIIVGIGALIATTSATLAMILSSGRIAYQISKDRLLPKVLRQYDPKTQAPTNAILLSSLIGIATLFAGNIYTIASISNFGLLFSYLITCLAQIHFRRQAPDKIKIKMPMYPYLTVIAIVLVLAFMIGMSKEALVIGDIMVISLLIVYYFLRELKFKKPVAIKLFS